MRLLVTSRRNASNTIQANPTVSVPAGPRSSHCRARSWFGASALMAYTRTFTSTMRIGQGRLVAISAAGGQLADQLVVLELAGHTQPLVDQRLGRPAQVERRRRR